MFSFFKGKSADKDATVVHAPAGGTLVRETVFPEAPAMGSGGLWCEQRALDGIPPQAALVDTAIPGQTTSAYVVDAHESRAPLALVNISGEGAHIELWELTADEKQFAKRRNIRLDPAQDTWSGYLLSDVACLSHERLLLAVFYYAPQVKQALFIHDIGSDTYTKLADVVPFADNRQKFFDVRRVSPDVTAILYFTGRQRLGPEVYYNTPGHIRLMSHGASTGTEVVSLGAADGSIRRWTVADNKLWIEATDYRDRKKSRDFIWSLDLAAILKP